MPTSGVHQLVFITQEADDNLNAALVIDAAPFAMMPELTLSYDEVSININRNNNFIATNYDDGNGRTFTVDVGAYDSSSISLNVQMAPSTYVAADYYDAVNNCYIFPGNQFKENVSIEFISSQVGYEDKVLKITLAFSPFSGGYGSEESPYLISRSDQFHEMKNDSHYLMINDIDFSNVTTWDRYSVGRFHFNGGNHSITGFKTMDADYFHGLFSYAYGKSVIYNLNIPDVNLNFDDGYAGVLLGQLTSDEGGQITISNVHVSGFASSISSHLGG
ncbi:MAG: hypothetical protein PHS54_07155, partial [Clostridia bacterium]|nr:hypothetical protein [Clostridia bacterium]